MAETKGSEDLDNLTFEEDEEEVEEEPTSEEKIDLEGFLQKRHGDNKKAPSEKDKIKWSMRYFILKDGTLFLYQNATDANPKKQYDLAGAEIDITSPKSFGKWCFIFKKDKLHMLLSASRDEDYEQWTKQLQNNMSKPASKPPKRAKKKGGLGLKTKNKIGEQVISSSIGKSILKETMNEDTWLVMNNIKLFVTKESGDKAATKMQNAILKFVVKVYILCREGMLTDEQFWGTVKESLWKTFSLLIDSLELSFAFEPTVLAKDVQELCKVFEKLFTPLISTKSIIELKSIFDYFSEPQVWEKLYTDPKYTNEITTSVKTLRKIWNQIKFPTKV